MIFLNLEQKIQNAGLRSKDFFDQLAKQLLKKKFIIEYPKGTENTGTVEQQLSWFSERYPDFCYYWENQIVPQMASILGPPFEPKKLLLAGPQQVHELFSTIKDIQKQKGYADDNYGAMLLEIFNYEKCRAIIQKTLKQLEWSGCPYCNRNFITGFTNTNATQVTFQMDHFFPKSKFPYLALSIYNLIPSCPTCNATIKKDAVIDTLVPYDPRYDFDKKVRFVERGGEIDIEELQKPEEYQTFVSVMCTLSIYTQHTMVLEDLQKKMRNYAPSWIEKIEATGLMTRQQIMNDLFQGYVNPSELESIPLAKLRKDLAEDLGINAVLRGEQTDFRSS